MSEREKRVCLDPGHDAGNLANKSPDGTYYEHVFTLDLGKRLEKLSMALMDLLVTGHGAVSLREVDMARLCRQAAEAARPAMAAKGLELQVSAQEGTLRGNESLLETMLINLLDNARKASESGTVVTLEAKGVMLLEN